MRHRSGSAWPVLSGNVFVAGGFELTPRAPHVPYPVGVDVASWRADQVVAPSRFCRGEPRSRRVPGRNSPGNCRARRSGLTARRALCKLPQLTADRCRFPQTLWCRSVSNSCQTASLSQRSRVIQKAESPGAMAMLPNVKKLTRSAQWERSSRISGCAVPGRTPAG